MTRPFAIIIVVLVMLAFGVSYLVQGQQVDFTYTGPFSVAVVVLTGAGFIFGRWAWHWPLVHLLTGNPRLSGTWVGTIRSDYKRNEQDDPLPPIPAVIVVTQTASSLSVRLFTQESRSTSVAASFEREEGDRFSLATVYRNEPDLQFQDRSAIHYGATRLAIEGKPRTPTRLMGAYWAARSPVKTSGMMDFEFVSREAAHSFRAGVELQKAEATTAKGPSRTRGSHEDESE